LRGIALKVEADGDIHIALQDVDRRRFSLHSNYAAREREPFILNPCAS
jgi:hypothetical protein